MNLRKNRSKLIQLCCGSFFVVSECQEGDERKNYECMFEKMLGKRSKTRYNYKCKKPVLYHI